MFICLNYTILCVLFFSFPSFFMLTFYLKKRAQNYIMRPLYWFVENYVIHKYIIHGYSRKLSKNSWLLIFKKFFLFYSAHPRHNLDRLKEKVFQRRKTFNTKTLVEHISQPVKAGKTQYRKCYSKTYSDYIS